MIPTLFGITLITFIIIQLAPGDPAMLKAQSATNSIGGDMSITQVVEGTRELYGLNKPIYIQYGLWLKRLVSLDFGESLRDHRPVSEKILEALPITLILNIITIFIVYLISVPLGAYCALKPNGFIDRLSVIVLFVLYSLPNFWVAMMLILWLGGGDYLNLFPITGFASDGAFRLPFLSMIANIAWHLVLPVVCLTYGSFAFLSRFARASMLEVVREDYIRTAYAKGLSTWRVVWHHAMRNALIPLVTLTATLLPSLIAGSVIIEQIFSIPGMGRLGFESVLSRDYPVIMAIAVISAVLTLLGVLISDILYMVVDPRISYVEKV